MESLSVEQLMVKLNIGVGLAHLEPGNDKQDQVLEIIHNVYTVNGFLQDLAGELNKTKDRQSSEGTAIRILETAQYVIQHTSDIWISKIDLEVLKNFIISLIEFGTVPSFPDRSETLFDEKDFEGTHQRARAVLQTLSSSLRRIHHLCYEDSGFAECVKSVATHLLCICASYIEQALWADETTIEEAKVMRSVLLTVCANKDITELLCGCPDQEPVPRTCLFRKGIYKDLLEMLKPKLQKNVWKAYPGLKQVFKWCLMHVSHHFLHDYLEQVLPPALIFADDFEVENKILGIQCLRHIIDNVAPTELSWFGRAEVIYAALDHMMYSQEVCLLEVLLPCMLSILAVLERPSKRSSQSPNPLNRYDHIFQRLLSSAEMENKIVLRRLYTSHLPQFILILGINSARHMKRLIRVITSYLEVYDGPEETARKNILSTLEALIHAAWPRISAHISALCRALIKLLYDIATDDSLTPSTVKQQIVGMTERNLILLKRCCEKDVVGYLGAVKDISTNTLYVGCIEKVLAEKN